MAVNDVLIGALEEEKKSILEQMEGYNELKKRLDAIEVLLSGSHNMPATKSNKYEKYWTWKQKVKYALNEIGEGYAEEVANKLLDFELDKSFEYLAGKAANYLSAMYNERDIDVVAKSGKKYKYGIKKEVDNVNV